MEKKGVLYIDKNPKALACVAQSVGWCPAKEKVPGSIPGQGTCLGYRACTEGN